MAERIIEGVWWIPGLDGYLPDSHMYVIGIPADGDFTLVDCGLMDKGSYKLEQIDKCGVPLKQVKRIIMTHTHLDHIGCLPELLEAIPHAEVWMHKDEAVPLERGDNRIAFGNAMLEMMVRSQRSFADDFPTRKVHRKLEGDEELSLGGIPFRVIHIPGHSIGGIGLFNEEHRLFLSGDTVYADGAIGRFDLVSADPVQLKQSLDLIVNLRVDILLPCHNRVVHSGGDRMVRLARDQWAPYLVR